MIIWHIACVFHTVLSIIQPSSEKSVPPVTASPPHFALCFETNAIDQ